MCQRFSHGSLIYRGVSWLFVKQKWGGGSKRASATQGRTRDLCSRSQTRVGGRETLGSSSKRMKRVKKKEASPLKNQRKRCWVNARKVRGRADSEC